MTDNFDASQTAPACQQGALVTEADLDLDALVAAMARLADDMEKYATAEWDEHENVRLAVAAITALRAERDAAKAPALAAEAAALDAARVKPLVWGGGVFFGQPAHFADIEFGRLMVVDHRMQGKGIKAYDTAGDSIGVFDDADAAKAALEADYEARIRAALAEPSPAIRKRGEG